MSEHQPNEHSSFIKTPRQLLAVVLLAFVIPILLIAMLASLASRSVEPGVDAKSQEAIAKRLKPVGQVVVTEGSEPAAAAPASVAAAAPAGGAQSGAANGKSIFDANCAACHAAGVAGAPKLGDKTAWAPRLKQGMDTLHQSALKGKGAMPPKGGNMSLADADVKTAVDFMAGQAK